MGSIWDRMEEPVSNKTIQDAVNTVLNNALSLTYWQETQLIQVLDAFPRPTLENCQERVRRAVEAKNKIEVERDELQATINLQHQRLERATAIWRAEKPEERNLIMPDLGDLLDWLLDGLQYWKEAAAHAYQEITKETRRAEKSESEVDRFKQRSDYVTNRWYEASKERDDYKAKNERLRNAIQEHKDDEKHRHVAYRSGQMESIADERLWAVLNTDTRQCPRCHYAITEWKRWGMGGEVCEDCELVDTESKTCDAAHPNKGRCGRQAVVVREGLRQVSLYFCEKHDPWLRQRKTMVPVEHLNEACQETAERTRQEVHRELMELYNSLRFYGTHLSPCMRHRGSDLCTCGLSRVLEKYEGRK